jgi:hypothetical protein
MQVEETDKGTMLFSSATPYENSDGRFFGEAIDSPYHVFGNYELADTETLNSWEKEALRNAEKQEGRGKVRGARLSFEQGERAVTAAQYARAISRLFNKRIFFVASSSKTPLSFDGMVATTDLKTIIINADASSGLNYLLGHELGHGIQHQQTALYDKLKEQILAMAMDRTDYNQRFTKKSER